MVKKLRQKLFFTMVATALIAANSLQAQITGSSYLGNQGDFGITVNGGYFYKNVYRVENSAPRFFLKGTYGVSERIDFFAQMGVTKLTLVAPGDTPVTFRDKHRLAYGAGATVRPLTIERLRLALFVSGQVIRYVSSPFVETESTVAGSALITRSELNYDWREADLYVGISKIFKSLNIYGGANIKFIQRIETRLEKLLFNGDSVTESRQSGEYNSGAIVRPMIGAELQLPARLSLNFSVSAVSRSDYSFVFGLSQTGKP